MTPLGVNVTGLALCILLHIHVERHVLCGSVKRKRCCEAAFRRLTGAVKVKATPELVSLVVDWGELMRGNVKACVTPPAISNRGESLLFWPGKSLKRVNNQAIKLGFPPGPVSVKYGWKRILISRV